MATAAPATTAAKTVDASLWWEPFSVFLTELENASVSSEVPQYLDRKLKDNHAWFLDTVSQFKPPSQKSREALDSPRVKIGQHELSVQPKLKDTALRISSILSLDEVQSYIIAERTLECHSATDDDLHPDFLNLVMLEYYIERQCLLKCTRQILMHTLYFETQLEGGSVVLEVAKQLISGGLERKLLSIFEDLLSSNYPEQMDFDLYTLWAEETLIEDNLILDILFLVYYESFCDCDAECWKKLCALYEGIVTGSYNFQKLAVSPDAIRAVYHAKMQLLLILIQSLNLESLLQMIRDNIPFRQGSIGFSEMEVQEMDSMISSFNAFESKELGPLILAWALFLCLVSSLPEKEENNLLTEIDHIGYVRQAMEASSLRYFLEILESDTLKYSDGPLAGYRSVLRTFVSAFIASYEISVQFEDDNLKLILDILCKIYQGEESLCDQFWDKDSFIDGPVRCLLYNLEGEFPFRTIELVRLLSALSEGAWSSECVFNFLDKSTGLSTPFEIKSGSVVDAVSKIVETQSPLHVAGVEGLVIPAKSRGQVLRMLDDNCALVRWEHTESGVESGVFVLLLRLAQELYMQNPEEVIVILDLLSRLASFNMVVCYALMNSWNCSDTGDYIMGNEQKYSRIDVIEIVCAVVKSLPPSMNGVVMMSMGVNLLTKMLKCKPSHVAKMAMKGNIFDVALRSNPFDVGSNNLSSFSYQNKPIANLKFSLEFNCYMFHPSGSWLLSGRLAKMLLIDCEQSDCSMTLSVLDFTMNLLETGLETDTVLALIVFSLQYVLINHEFWKYKVKPARWNVTQKVLEVMKKCILSISCCPKLGEVVRDIIFLDSSIHSAVLRIVCTTTPTLEKLHISRLFDIVDIEGLELAISTGLDVLVSMISTFSKNLHSSSVFHQAVLSMTTKPVPVITAAISFISYFRNSYIQIGGARLLSALFMADFSESYTYSNMNLGLDDKQVAHFRKSICSILSQQSPWNEDLIIATLRFLSSAASNQPAFLATVIASKEYSNTQVHNAPDHHLKKTENGSLDSSQESPLHEVLKYLQDSEDLLHRRPNVLLCSLNFLRALWQGAPQFSKTLEHLKVADKFWKHLTSSLVLITRRENLSKKLARIDLQNMVCECQILANVLDILGYEIFVQKKLMHAEIVVKGLSKSPPHGAERSENSKFTKTDSLKEIISAWCQSSVLSDLIKACVSWEYDDSSHVRAKVAAGLFAVHVMVKLRSGDSGSLSVSLIERIVNLSEKLCKLPVFSELLIQYTEHGYSGGQELETLILNDLFYHIQGELNGRQIDNRPFKELLQFLIDSRFLDAYKYEKDDDLSSNIKIVSMYDTVRLRTDLGLEMWDLLAWKEAKEVVETLLLSLQETNSKMLLSTSKHSALRGLVTLLYMRENNGEDLTGLNISKQVVTSCIDPICQSIHASLASLTPLGDAREEVVLDILTAQAELLLLLVRSVDTKLSQPDCVLILKASGYGLKVLCGSRPALAPEKATGFFLMLILVSIKLTCDNRHSDISTGNESIDVSAEVSYSSLGLLPLLCSCVQHPDHCTLSLATIDFILKGFSTPATWFPIIQKHFPLPHIVQKLQDNASSKTVPIMLRFLLILARVREGAEMLLNAGILASVRMLLSDLLEGGPLTVIQSERKTEKSQPIWGLSLALLTAIIQSLGDNSESVVDYVMVCILVEKAPSVFYYLSAPDLPSDIHENKRARALKSSTSLGELKEIQNTLALICVLAGHSNSWKKVLQNMESQLREKSIHLLAFISRATQHPGESPRRDAPLLCNPVLKEEFEFYKKPSFVNSRKGWFALSALGCKSILKSMPLPSKSTALVLRDQSNGHSDSSPQTHLSDLIAIEMYKTAFLLLKFLCTQAEVAAVKAEEVGFVDIADFPELPMPDILHGLQDQGIAIVTELCEASKMKQVAPEVQEVCLLLLQITVMALYLEYSVIQICGIRPVLGHVETFSKELRLLIRATEGHVFLKEQLTFLKQIVAFVYPDLVHQDALF